MSTEDWKAQPPEAAPEDAGTVAEPEAPTKDAPQPQDEAGLGAVGGLIAGAVAGAAVGGPVGGVLGGGLGAAAGAEAGQAIGDHRDEEQDRDESSPK